MSRNTEKWLVLRCPGQHTLRLEDELVEAGVTAWTPRVWVRKRVPRRQTRVWTEMAQLPSYLFIDSLDMQVARVIFGDRFPFRPMMFQDTHILLSDTQLDGLRSFDLRERPSNPAQEHTQPRVPKFKVGDKVAVGAIDHMFYGICGSVQSIKGHDVSLLIEKSELTILIPGFLLEAQ